MSSINIKTALSLGDKATIPSLGPVVLKNVYPMDHGTTKTDGTPYTKQNVHIMDNSGEARMVVWRCADLCPLQGRTVTVNSVTASGRLVGVAVRLNTPSGGTPRLEFQVNQTAVIVPEGAVVGPPVQVQPNPAPVTQTNQPDPLPGSLADKAKVVETLQGAFAKPTMADLVALFAECWEEARKIVDPENSGAFHEVIQSASATLYIQATRVNLYEGAEVRRQNRIAAAAAAKAAAESANIPF